LTVTDGANKQGNIHRQPKSAVAAVLAITRQHPDILPRSFSLKELEAGVPLVEDLYSLLLFVASLQGKIQDTYFAAGSEAYAGALAVYQYAKAHNLATGELEDALDDLGSRFARRGRTSHDNPPPGGAGPSV
jgi:hypothetical protein